MSRSFLDELLDCLRFYSRLPIPAGRGDSAMPNFGRAAPASAIAGAIIGAIGGVVLLLARFANLSALVSAACAIAALVAITGALHEDGLADTADGFGGGATREAKLAIMRDSRLGVFGACALCLALVLRVSALAAIIEHGTALAVSALIAAQAISRAAGLAPLALLPSARADGAGAAAARPGRRALSAAVVVVALVSLLPVVAGAPLGRAITADLGAIIAGWLVAKLAERQIGGYTGDVLGAAQQAAEVVVLLVFSASF
jgi:adenosylcobinamide-GDP ribazoletransferase